MLKLRNIGWKEESRTNCLKKILVFTSTGIISFTLKITSETQVLGRKTLFVGRLGL